MGKFRLRLKPALYDKLTEEGGKFLIDISKLIFGGAVLGVAMGTNHSATLVLIFGIISMLLCFGIGIFLLAQSKAVKKED